jgi:large subunit ribosomal protein L9
MEVRRKMKVILKADIKGVGKKDQVINASDGYARNFLLPKNLAVEANNENMSKLKAKQDSAKFQKNQEREEAIRIAEKLSKIQLKVTVKAGENGKIFGGVSSKEIAQGLEKEYKIKVDKKKIDLKETIKTLGTQTVEIKLFEGVIGKLKVDVISE